MTKILGEMTVAALSDFANVGALAGTECDLSKIRVEVLDKPHKPSGLPTGTMAVYCFFLNGQALKIGIAGPSSGPRYLSQHYNPNSAGSNLAKSISAHPTKIGIPPLHTNFVGIWIKEHTDRINILFPATFGKPMLSMLETFHTPDGNRHTRVARRARPECLSRAAPPIPPYGHSLERIAQWIGKRRSIKSTVGAVGSLK